MQRQSLICRNKDCGKTNAKQKCSKCLRVYYCDAKCQHAAWPLHRKECTALASPDFALSKLGIKLELVTLQAFESFLPAHLTSVALCYFAAVAAKQVPEETYVEMKWHGKQLVCAGFLPYDAETQFAMEPGSPLLQNPHSLREPAPIAPPLPHHLTFLIRYDKSAAVVSVPLERVAPNKRKPNAAICTALRAPPPRSPLYKVAYARLIEEEEQQ